MTQDSQSQAQKAARFAKGQSGNPGGLPKWRREVRDLMGEHAAEAAKFLIDLVNNPKAANKDRNSAAQFIIDHAIGKPVQKLSGDDENPISLTGLTVQFVQPAKPADSAVSSET